MAIGVTLFVIAVLIAAIWVIIEIQRLKHKLFAILLIALILFTYVSFSMTLKGQDVDLGSVTGLITAGKLYMSWLSSMFHNMKVITMHAINLDWDSNQTSV